ncbi:MAG: hypothetical protein JJE50_03165 [Actinomycetales bacterium]|nr:hypothetical protein [Actinomycetales bacterium]
MSEEAARRRRSRIWVRVSIVVVPMVVYLAGAGLAHALAVTLVWAGTAIVMMSLPLGDRVLWPRLPYGRHDGARREVSSLSWTLYGRGQVTPFGQRRLREVALAAFDHAGVDLATAQGRSHAEQLLGRRLLLFLLDPRSAPAPDARAVQRCVAALETLDLRKGHP